LSDGAAAVVVMSVEAGRGPRARATGRNRVEGECAERFAYRHTVPAIVLQTGARMTVTLVHEMRRRGVEYGAATLCGGGGQGYAAVLRLAA
jgi:Thiolase, C-terminal domain